MEAIAISPAPQSTTPQAINPAANAANQSDNDFGSTLSQTIEQQNATSEQPSQANTTNNNNQESSTTNSDSNPNQDSDNQSAGEQPAGLAASLPFEQSNELQFGIQASAKDTLTSKNVLSSELLPSLAQKSTNNQIAIEKPVEGNSQVVAKNPIIQLAQPTTSADIAQPTTSTDIKTQPEQTNSLLLNKIQQIIASSNETGTVSIRGEQNTNAITVNTGRPANAPIFPITEETITQATFSATSNSRVTGEVDTSKSISKVGLLRQDGQQIQPQNFKIDSNQNSGQNLQQSFSENSGSQQGFTTSSATISTNIPDTTTSFAQVSSQVTETNSQQIQASNKTGLATPNTAFQDNEVMNQVIQRFNVNPRLQTSKLSIQLNPVELGQLKIDILVKGDSIKANIVAQSQQAAEIIEKNMLRLKSVLEEQGFSIDDLTVSTVQENGESFNLFQENFSQPEQFSKSDKKDFSSSNFELPLDEMLADDNATGSSGVNVKI